MKLTERRTNMKLFHEYYSCYYQVVRQILSEAYEAPITQDRMRALSDQYGHSESSLAIVPKLTSGEWRFLDESFLSVLKNPDILKSGVLPLTTLQKSWLSALKNDPRFRLFLTDSQLAELSSYLSDTVPLYEQDDFLYFDRYLDSDPYDSDEYRDIFHTILSALRTGHALAIVYENQRGIRSTRKAAPYQLQYSSKDDKFRLCCLEYSGKSYSRTTIFNLARIRACHMLHDPVPSDIQSHAFLPIHRADEPVVIEISGERNSLERCMLHFANYEKHTEYNEETKKWLCSIYYDLADETELLIEILSFGPVIRVLRPDSFLRQIKARVMRQHELFYGAV